MKTKSAVSFAQKLLSKALIDDRVMLLKDGSMMGGFEIYAADLDSVTDVQRQDVARCMSDIISRYDGRYTLHVITHRVPFMNYLSGAFSEKVTQLIDEEREFFFKTYGNCFETHLYCFLTFTPSVITGKKAFRKKNELIDAVSLNDFKIDLDNFSQALSLYFRVIPLESDAYIAALDAILNGGAPKAAQLPESLFIPVEIDSLLARDFQPGSPLIYDNRYVSVVTVDGLPERTWANMMSVMSALPFEYTWSIRFKPMDRIAAQKFIDREYNLYNQHKTRMMDQILRRESGYINHDAEFKANDAQIAKAELDGEKMDFWQFHRRRNYSVGRHALRRGGKTAASYQRKHARLRTAKVKLQDPS